MANWYERVRQYNFNKMFHQTFYPGTNIATMPYRIPKEKKRRGYNWEKLHTQAVKLRRQMRYER